MSHGTRVHADVAMELSTLPVLPAGAVELGVVYASVEGVNEKARDLMAPVLGKDTTERLIAQINRLDRRVHITRGDF